MSNTDAILEQLAARRARRDAEYQRHANTLLDAKLIDPSAISRAARPAAIVRATPGETVTALSMPDFLDKYSRVAAGTTIDLGNTVLDFGNIQFGLRANVTVLNGEIRATRPKGTARVPEKNCFAMIAPAGTPGICFRKTRFRFNNGGVFFEPGVIGAIFDGVDVVHGTDGSYYSRLAYWAGGGLPGFVMRNGFYHDSQTSDRTHELWGLSRFDISFNRFDNVKDGGHIMENGGGGRMTSNLLTRLGRMGVEVQGNAVADGFLYEGNVITSFVNPYFDCELISMCAVNQTGVLIRRNYVDNSFAGPWGNVEDQGQRFGIAIEAMTADNGCIVEENVIGGPNRWACIVAAGSKNMLCRNQRVYGASTVWGDYVSEPGTRGTGTIQNGGGNQRLTGPMPAPPTIDFGGGDGNNQGDTPVFTLTGQTAKQTNPNGGGQILLTWSDPPKGTTKVRIHCRATGDNALVDVPEVAPTPIDFPVASDFPVVLDNVHPGWGVDVMAEAVNDGNTVLGSSSWQKMQTTAGLSTTKWPPVEKASNDVHLTIDLDVIAGAAKNVKVVQKAISVAILLLAACLFAGCAAYDAAPPAPAAPSAAISVGAAASLGSAKPTAEELALRTQLAGGGEVVIPAGKTIETHETLLLPNYLELRGTGARLNYTGDPNKPAVSYSAAYPMRTTIKGLTIKSAGRGIALEREGSHLQILDVEIDSDREPIYFVPALDPNGKPTQMVYSPTIDHLIVTNPRAETHLRVRMATLSHLMFQFGGASVFRGDALLKLDGDGSQGSLDCLWDEPAFAIDQVRIGEPGTNFAHWDITVPWYEPNKGGARVNATNAIIHTPYAHAQLGSPWVLRNSTVYTEEVMAIGLLGEAIDPKRIYLGDASSVMYVRGASVLLGRADEVQPQK